MAVRDMEAFIRERAAIFDANLDLNSGSPFDTQVIQPILRRLGTDPFTVDLSTFLHSRLRQSFDGDMALDEGDAIVDLLVKPATLLWDPVVREVGRVKQNLSFKDPTTMTVEEAEALGGNLFAERRPGSFSRGQGRVFFSQPQNIAISPVNFFTSKGGLRFFPTEAQTIRSDEMLLNLSEDGTYYFDVNVIAEEAGDAYNIGPDELISIANVESAVRVTNLRRFDDGEDEDTAEEFIDKARGELTERSLVTLRGISSQLSNAFPSIRRINVVGMNDPEMQRDIVKGGGVGPILAEGTVGLVVPDTENQAKSRRFDHAQLPSEVNFTTLIGPTTVEPSGFVLTVYDPIGFGDAGAPFTKDFDVRAVLSPTQVDLVQQELNLSAGTLVWTLRKKELTLSDIPGGILFPDGPQGTVAINDDEVHVGGMTDIYIRGTGFDEASIILDNVTDDVTELSGTEAVPPGAGLPTLGVNGFQLNDLVTGTDYDINSETFRLIERAGRDGLTLQIVAGPDSTNLGVFRIVNVSQVNGLPVELQVSPEPPSLDDMDYRWRLFDEVNIDLVDPKETRLRGDTLSTVQNSDIVKTIPATNFSDFGIAKDDVLRILEGPGAGDYTLAEDPLSPGFDTLRVDTPLKNTISNLSFIIFRPNAAGGILLPLIRIKSIELLDSSNQPLGSTIPYAKPVDIQSRAFQNPARGVKHTLTDTVLGIVSLPVSTDFGNAGGEGLTIKVLQRDGSVPVPLGPVVLPAAATPTDVVTVINAAGLIVGYPNLALVLPDGSSERVAIRPASAGVVIESGTGLTVLFGNDEPRTTADIRSAAVDALTDAWDELSPDVDFVSGLDVVQVIEGSQVGFYPAPYSGPSSTSRPFTNPSTTTPSRALIVRDVDVPADENTIQFAPELNVRVEIGARSLGSARCYFLEPTSIEFDERSFFYIETDQGLTRFVPDPTLSTQLLPPLPSDNKSNDGESAEAGTTFTAASQNFLVSAADVGDELVIDYLALITDTFPIYAGSGLPDPVPGLAGKTLIFSIDSGPNLTLTFIRDDVSLNPDEVSRDGVVSQINAKAGIDIASLNAGNELEFEADALITIRVSGTANPIILGDVAGTGGTESFDPVGNPGAADDQTNQSPHAGTYKIVGVAETELTIAAAAPFGPAAPYSSPLTRQGFRIFRPGVQRISTTQMAQNVAEAGLYYFDVELVSEGTGDLWNIDSGLQLFVDVYRSDGYYLTTDDSNLTFSVVERPKLVISKSILEEGVDDAPFNSTQIVGQNVQITYERSQLVADNQAFVTSETERVVDENALARHLIPHFVRFDINYVGGSREEVVVADIEKYIRDLFPADALESSDLQKIMSDRGATSIDNPIDLIAIVHDVERKVQATRSQNSLTTGRLAAFIPDILNVSRNTV